MASKSGSGLVWGHISQKIDIGSLGANSIATSQVGGSVTQRFRTTRLKGWCSVPANPADIGPMIFGIAQSNLTITEIDEAMSAQPRSSQDTPAVEHASRGVYPLAGMMGGGEEGVVTTGFDTAEGPFSGLSTPEGANMFRVFAWNADQAAAWTASRDLNFYFKYWGVWIR